MSSGDFSRKSTLVEYGFRLPSAIDNRPLKFEEFNEKVNQITFVSATPGPHEKDVEESRVTQIMRPTGLLDPKITISPSKNQIDNLILHSFQGLADENLIDKNFYFGYPEHHHQYFI